MQPVQQATYPLLAELIKNLAILATSVSAEHSFSSANLTALALRSRFDWKKFGNAKHFAFQQEKVSKFNILHMCYCYRFSKI